MNNQNLGEEQKIILKKFRIIMSDLLEPRHDDQFLLRWLKARNFNLQLAEKMLREDFKFRKAMKSDTVLTEYKRPEVIFKHLPSVFLGFSKEGHLVRFWDIGCFDAQGLAKSLSPHDMLMNFIYLFESDKKQMELRRKKTGVNVETVIYVADYSKLRLNQWCDRSVIRRCIQTAQFYQDHYPECMFRTYGINAPNFIVYLINVILKPFVPENVRKKFQFYATGDHSYMEELFSLIPKDVIPAYLGGERYDPDDDPTCDGLIHRIPKVSSCFYIANKIGLQPEDSQVKQKTVSERSVFEIVQEIDVPGTALAWQFQTKDHNIKFGLFYKRKSTFGSLKDIEKEELLPVENTESNIIVEQGEHICDKVGTYILQFDNTHSWWRSKHLLYKVEIRQPDAQFEI